MRDAEPIGVRQFVGLGGVGEGEENLRFSGAATGGAFENAGFIKNMALAGDDEDGAAFGREVCDLFTHRLVPDGHGLEAVLELVRRQRAVPGDRVENILAIAGVGALHNLKGRRARSAGAKDARPFLDTARTRLLGALRP